MTSREIHEQITAFVHERVDEQAYREKVVGQIKECADCGSSFERELSARLAAGLSRPQTSSTDNGKSLPGTAESESPVAAPAGESKEPPAAMELFADKIVSPIGIGAAVLIVLASVAVLLYNTTRAGMELATVGEDAPPIVVESKAPQNLFNTSFQNLSALLARQLPLQSETDDGKELAQFFKEKGVDYAVEIPRYGLPLKGGVVSEHAGKRLAHIVYASGDTVIYLMQIPVQMLAAGTVMYVTPDVQKRVESGERIVEESVEGQTLVLYRAGENINAAVANVPKTGIGRLVPVQ